MDFSDTFRYCATSRTVSCIRGGPKQASKRRSGGSRTTSRRAASHEAFRIKQGASQLTTKRTSLPDSVCYHAGVTDFGALGFTRVAAVQTSVRPGDPRANASAIRRAAEAAAAHEACVVLFPELSIAGYSCEDLFQDQGFLADVRGAIGRLASETKDLSA